MKSLLLFFAVCSLCCGGLCAQERTQTSDTQNRIDTLSRRQVVRTSFIPLPFGNRVFYDGVDDDAFTLWLLVLESTATGAAALGAVGVMSETGGNVEGLLVAFGIGVGVGLGASEMDDALILGGLAAGVLLAGAVGIEARATTHELMYYSLAAVYLFNILDACTFNIKQASVWGGSDASLNIHPIYQPLRGDLGLGLSLCF